MEFRALEREDLRFIWAAYKKDGLPRLGFDDRSMTPDAFKEAFTAHVAENFDAAWTLLAPTARGFLPVGFRLAYWAHPKIGVFMHGDAVTWFPWASPRNKIESAVNFFNRIRHEVTMIEYSRIEDKRLLEVVCAHGVMRRIGHSHSILDEPLVMFETRKP